MRFSVIGYLLSDRSHKFHVTGGGSRRMLFEVEQDPHLRAVMHVNFHLLVIATTTVVLKSIGGS